jgi:hypothetical protein
MMELISAQKVILKNIIDDLNKCAHLIGLRGLKYYEKS